MTVDLFHPAYWQLAIVFVLFGFCSGVGAGLAGRLFR
jgi:hypothetical protein